MLVVVVTADPKNAAHDAEGPVTALRDLGARVLTAGFDLDDLDDDALSKRAPNVVVVDAGDRLETGYAGLRRIKTIPAVQDGPTLLTVPNARLPSLVSATAGADDFVLRPIVPAELYARVRQLDWRLAAFAGDEVVKTGELVIDLAGYEARLRGRQLLLTHQ